MAEKTENRKRPGLMASFVSWFRVGFYPEASRAPLGQAVTYIAILCALAGILTARIQYRLYADELLPVYINFYEKVVPEELVFAEGRPEYPVDEPYKASMIVFEKRIGFIINMTDEPAEIPEENSATYLVTGEKMSFISGGRSDDITIPAETVNAREYLVAQAGNANPLMFAPQGVNTFVMLFAVIWAVIIFISAVIFFTLGRRIHGHRFANQVNICAYASTPLLCSVIALLGIREWHFGWIVPALGLALFILLAMLGTRETLFVSGTGDGSKGKPA